MGRAGADMIENGFSVQNVLQMASGGINLGGTAAMSRGYQSFSQVAGTAGTWLGRGTNIAGVAVNGYDMMVNGVTAQNSAALMENVAGLAGVGWACFAAGTPIQTPTGPKYIEWFKTGDLVLSRSELDPNGPVEAKRVEAVFVREALVAHLHLPGQTIRTTSVHRFCVEGKGWTALSKITPGERIATREGQWVAVEEVYETGETETVYNLRVADWHTYFVGGDDWGFSVWAHNTYGRMGVNRGNGGRGGGINHARQQIGVTKYAGGDQEVTIGFANGRYRVVDNVDASGRIHQIGRMRSRGGIFRPSSRERAAIEDLRRELGTGTDIIFHDKNGRLPSLINPDLQPGWRPAPLRYRVN